MRRSEFYSIAFDETTDVSGKNIMSIVARYIDAEDGSINEDFLGFYNTHDFAKAENLYEDEAEKKLTGIVLGKVVEAIMKNYGLEMAKIVSYGSDGAAVMTSKEKGAISYLKQNSKHAVHSYCLSHCLNLCISEVTGIPEFEFVIKYINKIASFFQ